MRPGRTAVFAVLVVALCIGPASGTNQRSFVASSGKDTDPCTLAKPCRSFAAAIAQTSANGEVVAIDSAGYGSVTIAQSVSVVAPLGVHAGIIFSSGDGVTVNAGPDDVVILRNLYINCVNGIGATHGINLISAAALHVEHCVVTGSFRSNINLVPATPAIVAISDTVVRQAIHDWGVYADSASSLKVSIERCRMELNYGGVVVDRAAVSIHDSSADGNGAVGFYAPGNGGLAKMAIEGCTASNNGTGVYVNNGMVVVHNTTAMNNTYSAYQATFSTARLSIDSCVAAGGNAGIIVSESADVSVANSIIADNTYYGIEATNGAVVRLTRNTITRNGIGIAPGGGSTVNSTGDNMVDGNTTDVFGTITPANKN